MQQVQVKGNIIVDGKSSEELKQEYRQFLKRFERNYKSIYHTSVTEHCNPKDTISIRKAFKKTFC